MREGKFVGKNEAKCSQTGKKLDDDVCAEAAIDSQIQARTHARTSVCTHARTHAHTHTRTGWHGCRQATTAVGIASEFWSEDCGGFTCMFRAINDAGDTAPRVSNRKELSLVPRNHLSSDPLQRPHSSHHHHRPSPPHSVLMLTRPSDQAGPSP